MISVIIPVRNKDEDRIRKVSNQFNHEIFKEVIVIDYGSEVPIKAISSRTSVIRYENIGPWNKAHAINLGVKNSTGKYIMTVDADILLEDGFENKLVLDENTYTYSGNVRRINPERVSNDFTYMWDINSMPWVGATSYSKEMYGLANGGLQLYPRRLIEEWNGIDENLVYSGGMDNITNLMAKKSGMNVSQLPIRLLHIEHDKQKQDNYPEEERILAMFITSRRGEYLNNWIDNPIKNEFYGEEDGPCYTSFNDEVKLFEENKEEIIKYSETLKLRDSKIMIAIINNTGTLPDTFVRSLLDLYNNTCLQYPNTTIKFIKACQVNHMRNIAVNAAIEEEYDYLIQLDVDHIYESDTIQKLMVHNKEFVTVPTKQRVSPFRPTQYKKLINPIKQEGNAAFVNDIPGLLPIEVSGPVAMLMKVSALKELEFPYYYMDYSYGFKNTMGGDYVFCRQLKEHGFKLYLDPTINCPHFVKAMVGSFGVDAEISLNEGTM